MAAAARAPFEERIDVVQFCQNLNANLAQQGIATTAEHLLEAIGGISTLYLEAVAKANKLPEVKLTTCETIVSSLVSRAEILNEIGNCAGCSLETTIVIFKAIEGELRQNFIGRRLTRRGSQLRFRPLGMFEVENLDAGTFSFTYRDPAGDNYSAFLLEHAGRLAARSGETPASWIIELREVVARSLSEVRQSGKALEIFNEVDASFWNTGGREYLSLPMLKPFLEAFVFAMPEGASVRLSSTPAQHGVNLIAEAGEAANDIVAALLRAINRSPSDVPQGKAAHLVIGEHVVVTFERGSVLPA